MTRLKNPSSRNIEDGPALSTARELSTRRTQGQTGRIRSCSLRMRDQRDDAIRIIDDPKIETPIVINAGLPDAPLFVVLLRAERRVAEIPF